MSRRHKNSPHKYASKRCHDPTVTFIVQVAAFKQARALYRYCSSLGADDFHFILANNGSYNIKFRLRLSLEARVDNLITHCTNGSYSIE